MCPNAEIGALQAVIWMHWGDVIAGKGTLAKKFLKPFVVVCRCLGYEILSPCARGHSDLWHRLSEKSESNLHRYRNIVRISNLATTSPSNCQRTTEKTHVSLEDEVSPDRRPSR